MSHRPKIEVTCRVMVNRKFHRSVKERRVVYKDKMIGRHVRCMGRKLPLDATNTYELHYSSVARSTL